MNTSSTVGALVAALLGGASAYGQGQGSPEPDYIVSAREPGHCLRVQGALRAGARLEIAPCDVADPAQAWDLREQRLRPFGQSTLCVGPRQLGEGERLTLQPCRPGALQTWRYQDQSFRLQGYAMDLSANEEPIDIYEHHGEANQRWRLLSEARQIAERGRHVQVRYPLAVTDTPRIALELARDQVNRLTPLHQALPYPRDIATYPGLMPADAPPSSARFSLDRRIGAFRHIGWQPEWHQTLHTGLWAPAGRVIRLRVEAARPADLAQLTLQISEQNEVLATNGKPLDGDPQLKRFPAVSMLAPLKPGLNEIRSQYGGFIQINSHQAADATVHISIEEAVAAPYFHVERHGPQDWARIRQLPGPWVLLEGRRSVITVPREQVRDLKDPQALMAQFDTHVENIEWLAGFDGSGPLHPRQRLKHHITWSPQVGFGWAHAGYPIRTSGDWPLTDVDAVKRFWGNVHELGHNYQQSTWCNTFGSESTVNLFSLYAMEQMGQPAQTVVEDMYGQAVRKLKAGRIRDFARDADDNDKLVFLVQIMDAVPQRGWQIYRELFRAYRELSPAKQQALEQGEAAAQYDQHYVLMSRITGLDLRDHYRQWAIPLSAGALAEVAALKLRKPATPTWLYVRTHS